MREYVRGSIGWSFGRGLGFWGPVAPGIAVALILDATRTSGWILEGKGGASGGHKLRLTSRTGAEIDVMRRDSMFISLTTR